MSSPEIPAAPHSIGLPNVIADHFLIRCIGVGAYGTVWLARNEVTQTFRAIKVVFRNAFKDDKPYEREFEAIKRFEPISRTHPGFVQVLQVGQLEGAFYYIMELADDQTSGNKIDPDTYLPRTLDVYRESALPIPECALIGSQLASCLGALHESKLIHRDIKPSNIIFVGNKPKLADIGLVAQINEAKSFVGTAGFVAPEGPIRPESDIYSLGKVLYEISTGRDRTEFPLVQESLSPDNFLALELNQILLKACDPNPEKRYPSAADLQHELDLLQAGKSIKRIRRLEMRERALRRILFLVFAIGGPLLFIFWRVKDLRNRESQEQQRRIGYLLARGTDEMRKGDFAASLPFFLDSAAEDKGDVRTHSLRVGAVLAHASRPVKVWHSLRPAKLSDDGERLVSIKDASLIIYNSRNGNIVQELPVPFRPQKVAISKDRSVIAALGTNRIFFLGDLHGRTNLINVESGSIVDAVIHPSNDWVAILTSGGQTIFWNTRTQKHEMIKTPQMYALRFSPNGSKILLTSQNPPSRLYEFPPEGKSYTEFQQPFAYGGVFSGNGNVLVTYGFRSAMCWQLNALDLHPYILESDDSLVAAFSGDGSKLAVGSYNGLVSLWDGTNFQAVVQNHTLYHPERVENVAFIGNTTLIVQCIDGSVFVWNLPPSGEVIEKLDIPVPVPEKLVIQSSNINLHADAEGVKGTFRNKSIHVSIPGMIGVIAASPLNNIFAVGLRDDGFLFREVLLFHAGEQIPFHRVAHRDGILSIQFSNDGRQIVTGSEDYTAIVWDVESGKPISAPMKHNAQVRWACFSSDGRWVATLSQDAITDIATAVVWDARTGDPLTPPMILPDTAKYIRFESGDSTLLVSNGSASFRLRLPFAAEPLEQYRGILPSPPNVSRASPQISSASSPRRVAPFFASQSASRF